MQVELDETEISLLIQIISTAQLTGTAGQLETAIGKIKVILLKLKGALDGKEKVDSN